MPTGRLADFACRKKCCTTRPQNYGEKPAGIVGEFAQPAKGAQGLSRPQLRRLFVTKRALSNVLQERERPATVGGRRYAPKS